MPGSGLMSNESALKPHQVQAGKAGLPGEIGDLRRDLARTLAPLAAITVEEFTNPPAADVDAFKLAFASATSASDFTGAELDGVVGDDALTYPRNVTVTTGAGGTPADAPATVTFIGIDVNDQPITETLNISQTAATVAGVKAFKRVTQVTMPAGEGTGATLELGFGLLIGLAKKLMTRAGFSGPVREIAVGSVVTNGVFAAASTGLPNGTYSPNSAADGTRDYALYYEYDPTA